MIRFNGYEVPQAVLDSIKSDLTVPNLDKIKAEKAGRWARNIPDSFRLYEITNGVVTLPRGYGTRLADILKQHQVKYTMEDKRLILPQVTFGSRIGLFDYQGPAVERLVKFRTGGVSAPCGSGKTMIGLEAIARVQQPALWITHTKELLEQAVERACQVLDIKPEEIGIIGSGKFTIGDRLTVALVQTLAKRDLTELVNRFGTVFVDEAHHLAANQFFKVVNKFPALYRMWASATPNRDDGKTPFIEAAGGPILHSIPKEATSTLRARVIWVPTAFRGTYDSGDYQTLLDDIVNDQERNNLIVETIAREWQGNYSLVLSERVAHLELLYEMLKQTLPAARIEILTGKLAKKKRTEVMARVQDKKVDILLATQLAREGLDIVHLNKVFLTMPKRAENALTQEVGRVLRPAPGKTDAVVFDFMDTNVGILKAQKYKRYQVYRNMGAAC